MDPEIKRRITEGEGQLFKLNNHHLARIILRVSTPIQSLLQSSAHFQKCIKIWNNGTKFDHLHTTLPFKYIIATTQLPHGCSLKYNKSYYKSLGPPSIKELFYYMNDRLQLD